MTRSCRVVLILVVALVMTAALSEPAAGRTARAARGDPVETALRGVVAAGAPGAIALAAGPNGVKAWAVGYAQLRPRVRMRPADRFHLASATKPFTATIVLQLVGEGTLSLDDTVERWLPGKVPNGGTITIRELLGHRSGLFDFNSTSGYLKPYLAGDLEHAWTPDQLLALSTALPPLFAPGTRYAYSNTNFLLLRMIVEAATGTPLPALLQQRIFAPLGMRSTSVDDNPGIAGPAAHGYIKGRVRGRPQIHGLTDTTPVNLSALYGTGDMSSTARDLATFFRALVGGKLLPPDLLAAMLDTPSGVHYGLGIMRSVKPSPCGELYGHTGSIPGYGIGAWTTRTGHFSFFMTNRNDGVPAPGFFKVLSAGDKALKAADNAACHL